MKMKCAKNVVISSLFLLTGFSGTVDAMQFSQPIRVGSYYNARAGGPSLARGDGYSKMTKDRCIFGKGDQALTFTHKNIYSSVRNGRVLGASTCTGVYVGKQKVEKLSHLNGTIYRILGDHGEVFYFVYGGASVERDFALIGLCEGSYYHAIGMNDLNSYIGQDLRFIDSSDALQLSAPETFGDEIRVQVMDFHKNIVGQFIFLWDESAKWFGINYQSY